MRHRGSASLQVGGELGRRWEGKGRQGVEDEASCKRKYADEGGGEGRRGGGREEGGEGRGTAPTRRPASVSWRGGGELGSRWEGRKGGGGEGRKSGEQVGGEGEGRAFF